MTTHEWSGGSSRVGQLMIDNVDVLEAINQCLVWRSDEPATVSITTSDGETAVTNRFNLADLETFIACARRKQAALGRTET